MFSDLGQVYAWASPDYILQMDWRLVFMYLDFAREKLYKIERENRRMENDLKALDSFKAGKIIRTVRRSGRK